MSYPLKKIVLFFIVPAKIMLHLIAKDEGWLGYFSGVYLRNSFLTLISLRNESLARAYRDEIIPRPYSVVPLKQTDEGGIIIDNQIEIKKGGKYLCGINILRDRDISQISKILGRSSEFIIGGIPFTIESVSIHYTTYKDFLMSKVHEKVRIVFLSPTALKRPHIDWPHLFPAPAFLFASLLRLWNAFSPHRISERVLNNVSKNVRVKRYSLKTIEVALRRGKITGFIGSMVYHILKDKEILVPLLRFGEFSNVGWKRSAGFGVIKISHKEKLIM